MGYAGEEIKAAPERAQPLFLGEVLWDFTAILILEMSGGSGRGFRISSAGS